MKNTNTDLLNLNVQSLIKYNPQSCTYDIEHAGVTYQFPFALYHRIMELINNRTTGEDCYLMLPIEERKLVKRLGLSGESDPDFWPDQAPEY